MTQVQADLKVVESGVSRLLDVGDFNRLAPNAATQTTLGAVLARLEAVLAVSGVVALDAPTLAALEQITATINGALALDTATINALKPLTTQPVSGSVSLDAPTLAALESITAIISGPIALDATTLAALESITAAVTGTVALDSATLTALESISVQNFPATQVVTDAPLLAAVQAADTARNADDDALRALVATEATQSAQKASLDFRYSGGKTSVGGVLNTAGTNVVITPAAGKRIRVFWVSMIPSSDGAAANLVTVAVGSQTLYVAYAVAHWEVFTGVVNASVTFSLANTQPVAYTVHYQEI